MSDTFAAARMADVAKLAGVSLASVSRALRAPDSVSPGTRDRVQRAAARLGYTPSPIAGSLSATCAPLVGVVMPSMANAFFARSFQVLSEGLERAGLRTMPGFHEYDDTREARILEAMLHWKPAAMVVTGLNHSRRVLALLAGANCPVFEMWDIDGHPVDSAVGFSNAEAGRLAAQTLLRRGCRDLVYVTPPNAVDPRAAARAGAFLQTVSVTDDARARHLRAVDRTAGAGADAIRRLIDLDGGPPDGIAFSGDALAMGALFEAQRLELSVPERIAVVGYGDLEFAGYTVPALTTLRPAHDRIGQELAAHIIARLADPGRSAVRVDVGIDVVARESA